MDPTINALQLMIAIWVFVEFSFAKEFQKMKQSDKEAMNDLRRSKNDKCIHGGLREK